MDNTLKIYQNINDIESINRVYYIFLSDGKKCKC